MAICGIRGIPACYGGFETFAEELSIRLAARGHRVVVYGRRHVIKHPEHEPYRGVELRLLPALRHKYFETPVHTLLCLLDVVRRPVDAVLVCNAANSPFLWIARLRGIPAAVNVDGVERKRRKWNALGRAWYRLGEICSVLFASRMISDAEVIRDYYEKTYHRSSVVIAYGHRESDEVVLEKKMSGAEPQGPCHDIFPQLGIAPGAYLLYVSRLEPENNAHVVIEAYGRLPEKSRRVPLVIVGDAPYAKQYIAQLKKSAMPGVIFAGYQFGAAYEALQLHAALYVQATEVGGTHPALVEAMGFANCIVANDTPENREVLGDAGLFYAKNDAADLSSKLQTLLEDRLLLLRLRQTARARSVERFSWEEITNSYEALFRRLIAGE